jgi:hypothetical protein
VNSRVGTIRFQYPVYPDLNFLPNDKRVYACWYYYTLAMKHEEQLADPIQGGLHDDQLWQTPHFEQIARTVAMIYGWASPDEFMKESCWMDVEIQAAALNYPAPTERVKHPLGIILVN